MVFYMGDRRQDSPLGAGTPLPGADSLTPTQVVAELDRYIVGQAAAKRAVAVALRNRWRRRQLPPALAEEVQPKNILMIGPTGVGKTEIARRLARLTGSPFIKVEATKYTEVGYVGRDCESMVRDLVEVALEMARNRHRQDIGARVSRAVEDRLLQALCEQPPGGKVDRIEAREAIRARLRAGELEDETISIEVEDAPGPAFRIAGAPGMDEIDIRLGEMMPGMLGRRTQRKTMKISQARGILTREEEERHLEQEELNQEALRAVEDSGIIFIDELDKVAVGSAGQGPDVSRQGVQRDLLPIIEGTIVQTKHGAVRTDHILFIAAGAFHLARPSDLIPELQGRLPIRVELDSLGEDDFRRILTEPENSLVRQYRALLQVDGIELEITDDAVREIARAAEEVNRNTEDIGARRLATLLERILEPALFDAPDQRSGRWRVDAEEVRRTMERLGGRDDFARYVL
ncbi:MAG: ATP-dependent protease ATPase subunit HslU [Acidobacteriota bacterium]|nr:ATP-dependent protease ATPase subunit HslU [Acidobacteriota bacterium]